MKFKTNNSVNGRMKDVVNIKTGTFNILIIINIIIALMKIIIVRNYNISIIKTMCNMKHMGVIK